MDYRYQFSVLLFAFAHQATQVRFTHSPVVTTPSHTEASKVFRISTECASVPWEGRTFQFDAGAGWGGGLTFPFSAYLVPLRQGRRGA